MKKIIEILWWAFGYVLSPVAWILSVWYALSQNVGTVYGYLDTLHTSLASASSYVTGTGFGSYFAKVNTIAPAYEFIYFLGILLALKLLAASVRIIKSFIPTIA